MVLNVTEGEIILNYQVIIVSFALHVTKKTENEMLADLDKQVWLDNTL